MKPAGRTPPQIQPETDTEPAENGVPPIADAYSDLTRVLDQIGVGNASVEISRVALGDTRPQYLDTWPASEFTLQALADAYGGGKFYVKVRNSNGTYAANGTIPIDPSRKPKAQPAPAPEPPKTDPVLLAILDEMKASREEMKALRAAPVAAPVDPTQQLVTLSQVVKNLQPAGGADAGLAAVVSEMRAELRALRDRKPDGGLRETLELLQTAKELLPDAAPERGGGGGFMEGLAGALAPMIAKMVMPGMAAPAPLAVEAPPEDLPKTAQSVHNSAAHPPAAQSGTAAAAHPPAPAPAASVPDAGGLADVVFAAAAVNEPVEVFNEKLEEHLSARQYNGLCEVLERDTWLTELFGADKRADTHKAWLTNLRAVMLGEDEEEDKAA